MLDHDCTPKHLHKVLMKKSRFASKTVRESMTTAPEVIKGTPYNPDGVQAEYKATSNKARIEQAEKNLQSNEDEVRGRIFSKEDISDQTIVDGQILAAKLQKSGHFNDAINVLETLSEKLSRAGQTVQAASIWNKLTPEGALKYAEKVVKDSNKKSPKGDIAEKLNKKAKKIIEAVGKPDDLDLENAVENAKKTVKKKAERDSAKRKATQPKPAEEKPVNAVKEAKELGSYVEQFNKKPIKNHKALALKAKTLARNLTQEQFEAAMAKLSQEDINAVGELLGC